MGYFAEQDLENNPYIDHCEMCNIYSEDLEEVIIINVQDETKQETTICPDCLKFLKKIIGKAAAE